MGPRHILLQQLSTACKSLLKLYHVHALRQVLVIFQLVPYNNYIKSIIIGALTISKGSSNAGADD